MALSLASEREGSLGRTATTHRGAAPHVNNGSSRPSSYPKEELPWVCYVWPCSARPKCFMKGAASRLPCARRKPCCSTWRSKAACIPAVNWPPCCGLTAILLMHAEPYAMPSCCCAACSPTPTPQRLLLPCPPDRRL